jgi:hypothetical protein
MNFSEFKKLLGADPRNSDPETLRARDSGSEFEQAAIEAETFEQKLSAAIDVPVNTDSLLADILKVPTAPKRRFPVWMAAAASLVMVAGVVGYMWDGLIQPDTVEEFVAQHYHHDGEKLLDKAGAVVPTDQVNKIMAGWDLEASPELLERVTFIKKCFTMKGMGAHMIVQTDQGAVNLIVMPKTSVSDKALVSFDNMEAHLVALGSGSAAIIGRDDQSVSGIDLLIRRSITSTI